MSGIYRRFSWSASLFALLVFDGLASAQDAGLVLMPKFTVVSPKGTYRMEQYRDADGGNRQIWVRDLAAKQSYQLKDSENEPSGYVAEFSFAPDEQYFMRTQKIGSGDGVVILYGRAKDGRFHDLSRFSDGRGRHFFDGRAWEYFDKTFGFTDQKTFRYHTWTEFLGWEADGKTFGLELSARHCGEEYSVYAWRLHYNLETGQFFLTAGDNAYNMEKKNGVHWKRNGRFE